MDGKLASTVPLPGVGRLPRPLPTVLQAAHTRALNGWRPGDRPPDGQVISAEGPSVPRPSSRPYLPFSRSARSH